MKSLKFAISAQESERHQKCRNNTRQLAANGNSPEKHTLSASLAKKTAPLPTPSVPFFFLPFLSNCETDQVSIGSFLAFAPPPLEVVADEGSDRALDAATRSSGVVNFGRGGESGMTMPPPEGGGLGVSSPSAY
jgi:hypothetical protein